MDFAKNNGTTSVKVHHAPGGKSNFSLSWDAEPHQVVGKIKPTCVPQQESNAQKVNDCQSEKATNVQTSVKVHAPPGGKSNFTLG